MSAYSGGGSLTWTMMLNASSFNSGIQSAIAQLGYMQASTRGLDSSLRSLATISFAALIGGVAGITAALYVSTKAAADFQTTITSLSRMQGIDRSTIDGLKEYNKEYLNMLDIKTRVPGVTDTTLKGAAMPYVQADIKGQDLVRATELTLKSADLMGVSTEEIANYAIKMKTLNPNEYNKYGNLGDFTEALLSGVNEVAKKYVVSPAELIKGSVSAAGSMQAMGLNDNISKQLGTIATLVQYGVNPGTLKSMLTSMMSVGVAGKLTKNDLNSNIYNALGLQQNEIITKKSASGKITQKEQFKGYEAVDIWGKLVGMSGKEFADKVSGNPVLLTQAIDKISKLGLNSPDQAQLYKVLLGGYAAREMPKLAAGGSGAMINEASGIAKNAMEQSTKGPSSIDKAFSEFMMDANAQWDLMWGKITGIKTLLGTLTLGPLAEMFKGISERLQGTYDWLRKIAESKLDGTITSTQALGQVFDAVKGKLVDMGAGKALAGAAILGGLLLIKSGIVPIGIEAAKATAKLIEMAGVNVASKFSTLASVAGTLGGITVAAGLVVVGLAAIGYALNPSKFTEFNKVVTDAFNGIIATAKTMFDQISKGDYSGAFDTFKDALKGAWDYAKNMDWKAVGNDIVTMIGDGAKAAIDTAAAIGTWLYDNLRGWANSGGPYQLGSYVAEKVGEGIKWLLGGSNFWDALKTAFSVASSWLQLGYDIIAGIGSGILGKIKDYLVPAQNEFIDFIKSVGDAFFGLGRTIGTALDDGLNTMLASLEAVLTTIGRTVPGAAAMMGGINASTTSNSKYVISGGSVINTQSGEKAFSSSDSKLAQQWLSTQIAKESASARSMSEIVSSGIQMAFKVGTKNATSGLASLYPQLSELNQKLTVKSVPGMSMGRAGTRTSFDRMSEEGWSSPDVYGYSYNSQGQIKMAGVEGILTRDNNGSIIKTNDKGETTYSGKTDYSAWNTEVNTKVSEVINKGIVDPLKSVYTLYTDPNFTAHLGRISSASESNKNAPQKQFDDFMDSLKWHKTEVVEAANLHKKSVTEAALKSAYLLTDSTTKWVNVSDKVAQTQVSGMDQLLGTLKSIQEGGTAVKNGGISAGDALTQASKNALIIGNQVGAAFTNGGNAVKIGLTEGGKQIAIIGSVAQSQYAAAGGRFISDVGTAATSIGGAALYHNGVMQLGAQAHLNAMTTGSNVIHLGGSNAGNAITIGGNNAGSALTQGASALSSAAQTVAQIVANGSKFSFKQGSTNATPGLGLGSNGSSNQNINLNGADMNSNFKDMTCMGDVVLVNGLKYTNPQGVTSYINPMSYIGQGGIANYQGTNLADQSAANQSPDAWDISSGLGTDLAKAVVVANKSTIKTSDYTNNKIIQTADYSAQRGTQTADYVYQIGNKNVEAQNLSTLKTVAVYDAINANTLNTNTVVSASQVTAANTVSGIGINSANQQAAIGINTWQQGYGTMMGSYAALTSANGALGGTTTQVSAANSGLGTTVTTLNTANEAFRLTVNDLKNISLSAGYASPGAVYSGGDYYSGGASVFGSSKAGWIGSGASASGWGAALSSAVSSGARSGSIGSFKWGAKGAKLDGPTALIAGEKGEELLLPNNLTKLFLQLAAIGFNGGNGGGDIIIKLDGKIISRTSAKHMKNDLNAKGMKVR